MDELNEKDLTAHLNNLPNMDELIAAAAEDLPDAGKIAIDQGVAYVRDVAKKMCENVEYGTPEWDEVWAASTVVTYNVLTSMIPIIDGLDEKMVEGIILQLFLLGTRGKADNLESMMN